MADYRGSASKIEVSATANATGIALSEKKQRELQERRRAAFGIPINDNNLPVGPKARQYLGHDV
jgi:hypothetical protein